MKMKYSMLAVVILVGFQFVHSQKTVTLPTRQGPVTGVAVEVNGENVYQFRKIPYAKPPIGSLRFEKPQPYGQWSETLDATKFGPSCMQSREYLKKLPNTEMSEDCLYLNIYVPRNWSNPFLMPAMVWIHGGGFKQGQGMKFNGSELALRGQVIVVTLNYRLNIFGFLTTGDSTVPGNYGLWDQQMAIAWVKSNINSFGGNPDSITIFGESAGGKSVAFQTLYPGNKGLFNRAIIQSGVANSLSAISQRAIKSYQDFGFSADCTTIIPSSAFKKCLQRINASSLITLWDSYVNSTLTTHLPHFANIESPCVDGSFVPAHPVTLLNNTSSPSYSFFRSLDIIAGTTDGEGSLIIKRLEPFQQKFLFNLSKGISSETFCAYIAASVAEDYFDERIAISNAICKFYRSTPPTDIEEQGRRVVDMYGDGFVVSPTVQFLNAHSKNNINSKTYQYLFSRFSPIWKPPTEWYRGAPHASELPYLFGFDFFDNSNITRLIPAADQKLSEQLMDYWINFARSGDPNSGDLPSWPEYGGELDYENLDTNITTEHQIYVDRVKFWLYDLPKI